VIDEEAAVDVSVIGYGGAVVPTVALSDLLEAAGKVGTPEELVVAELSIPEVASAALELLVTGDEDVANVDAAVLDVLEAMASMQAGQISLGDVLDVSGDEHAALRTGIEVVTLIDALAHAEVANLEHAISAEALVGGGILAADLRVIEPPRIAIGPAGKDAAGGWRTQARTAQLGLDLDLDLEQLRSAAAGPLLTVVDDLVTSLVDTTTSLLGNVVCTVVGPLISCPPDPSVSEDDVALGTLSVDVALARGTAGLDRIGCASDGEVTTQVTLDTATAQIGEGTVASVTHPELAGDLLLATDVAFSLGTVADEERVVVGPFAAAAEPVSSDWDLSLQVGVVSLVGTAGLEGQVDGLLDPVTALLATLVGTEGPLAEVVGGLPSELGVNLATAEVGALETRCGSRALARGDRWLTVTDGEDDLDG
jgi:hypothetical protein